MLQLSFDDYLSQYQSTKSFNASSYQKSIFQWVENGEGSCVVNAVPGSGKSTTLVESSHYIPSRLSSQFLAFNKHIVEELKTKLPRNVSCSTIHGLGFSSIKRILTKTKVNGNKYSKLIRQYLIDKNVTKNKSDYENLAELIRLTQLTLTDFNNYQEFVNLINYYDIPIQNNYHFWQQAVCDILEQGIKLASVEVSFDDMIYLPNILDLPIKSSNFLFVDECQDLNQAQLSLVMKAFNSSTRGLFVGDKYQSIMGFCGADIHSIDNIINQTKAIQLPLSISYRLPKSHIELANKIYNVIESAPHAIEGIVDMFYRSNIPDYVEGNDLIICRCFAPIVRVYFSLIRNGIPAQIKNKDISNQLISLLNTVFPNHYIPISINEFERQLDIYFNQKQAELLEQDNNLAIINLMDKIETLNVIYSSHQCNTITNCISAINQLCKPSNNVNPVNLTTIHGAKGLEAERVFLLRPDLIPHSLAKKDYEIEQEKNLMFVALSRSKHTLFFCT